MAIKLLATSPHHHMLEKVACYWKRVFILLFNLLVNLFNLLTEL